MKEKILKSILSFINLIGNFLKIQTFWIARCTWILDSGKDIFYVFFHTIAKADIQQCPDKQTCHIMEEIVCMNQDLHLFGVSINFDFVDLSHCGF